MWEASLGSANDVLIEQNILSLYTEYEKYKFKMALNEIFYKIFNNENWKSLKYYIRQTGYISNSY